MAVLFPQNLKANGGDVLGQLKITIRGVNNYFKLAMHHGGPVTNLKQAGFNLSFCKSRRVSCW